MAEIENFLQLAESRNTLIPELIRAGQVYMPAKWYLSFVATNLCRSYVSGLDVTGVNHLKEATDLVREGKKLIIVSNHQSDADHTAKRCILEELGFRELARRLFFLGGFKMIEREETRRLMPAENTVFVLTPADAHNLLKVQLLSRRGMLTEEQAGVVAAYQENCQVFAKASSKAINDQMDKGSVLAFCPEGTRTRDKKGRIGRASQEIAKLLPKDENTWVLPIMTNGTANIMTLGDKFGSTRTRLSMAIGAIYPSREIYEVDIKDIFLGDSRATRADVVMARLAVLMPDLVAPEDLDFYRKVCGKYDPMSNNGIYHSESFLDVFQGSPLESLSIGVRRRLFHLFRIGIE